MARVRVRRCLPLLTLGLLIFASSARAADVRFDITTNSTSYNVGDVVSWEVRFSILNSDTTNFGIETLALNSQDSFNETLITGTVNTAAAPLGFDRYTTSGGTFDVGTSRLLEIGATIFNQNNSQVVGADTSIVAGSVLNDLQLATGSFTATAVGNHTLIGTAGSANNFFTAAGQAVGNGTAYTAVTFNNADFTVAVPEPGSAVVCSALGGILLFRRRRG